MTRVKKTFLEKLPKEAHKYSHGTLGVIAGSPDYSGAAVLCLGGARRGGSGYINFIYQDEFTRQLVLSAYPDVVARKSYKDLRVDCWIVGPGSPDLERRFSTPSSKYAVLDSDAMKYAKDFNSEFVVITPHEGEARQLGFAVGDGDFGRRASALEMAQALGCIVVLKGHRTVVASPDGLVVVDELAGSELATAGTGDILTGLIGSMLASWKPKTSKDVVIVVFKAISAHALAAKAASKELNPITSTDILQYLPIILNQ
jgi:hydroxyethylthiazole kinase-like uncharacterized protein yjeF